MKTILQAVSRSLLVVGPWGGTASTRLRDVPSESVTWSRSLAVVALSVWLVAQPTNSPAGPEDLSTWYASNQTEKVVALTVATGAPLEQSESNLPATAETVLPAEIREGAEVIQVANLIYAGSKSSVCFSSKFLKSLAEDSHIDTDPQFAPVRLDSPTLYDFPFAIMTGEGTFVLPETERRNLADFLHRGGFVLASAGCSSQEWNRSFRAELARIFPDLALKKLPLNHPLFRTIFAVDKIALKNGGTTQLEGLEINGRIVLVYAAEGLNATPSVKGCCCCGGNEIKNSHEINVNIFAYAVLH